MSTIGALHMTGSYLLWMVYLGLNLIYRIIRHVCWRFNGTYALIEDSARPENYRRSAHVKRIIFRHRLDFFISSHESDFVTVHDGFIDPERLLGDDFTIYTFSETEAIFVQAEPTYQKRVRPLWQSDFYAIDQSLSAINLISIPLNHFHKLVEDMEGDGGKIVFLENQARAGGTLLTSIFKHSKQCVAFNEPHAYNVAVRQIFSDKLYHGEAAKRMFKNAVRILCKPYKGLERPVLAYAIKPTVLSIVAAEMAHEVFPDCAQFFMYRDARVIAVSLRRIGEVLNTLKLMFYLPRMPFDWFVSFLMDFIGYTGTDFKHWIPTKGATLEFGYRIACLSIYHYQQALKHGVNMHGIRYSDLCSNQKKVIRDMFAACDLPAALVDKAELAMASDSQGTNSPISRVTLQQAIPNPPKITSEFLAHARVQSEEWGAPDPEIWEDKSFRLPNTLIP